MELEGLGLGYKRLVLNGIRSGRLLITGSPPVTKGEGVSGTNHCNGSLDVNPNPFVRLSRCGTTSRTST